MTADQGLQRMVLATAEDHVVGPERKPALTGVRVEICRHRVMTQSLEHPGELRGKDLGPAALRLLDQLQNAQRIRHRSSSAWSRGRRSARAARDTRRAPRGAAGANSAGRTAGRGPTPPPIAGPPCGPPDA